MHGGLAAAFALVLVACALLATSLVAVPASAGVSTGARPLERSCWPGRIGPAEGVLEDGAAERLVVTMAYCAVLRRHPDPVGLRYWSAKLADGMRPVELVGLLLDSPEHRSAGRRSYRQSLDALTLSPQRRIERARRARELEARRQAALARQAAAAEAAKRAAMLRLREPMTGSEFGAWVVERPIVVVEDVTESLVHGRLTGSGQRVNVAYVHLSQTRGMRVSPADRGRAAVGAWAEEIGAHVAINGNWFGPFDGPAVSNGTVYGGTDHDYTALFGFTVDGDAIIEHHREMNDDVDDRVVEAVAGHPTLIHRGTQTTEFGNDPAFVSRQPRTAIGLDETGDVLILVTVDGRSRSARGMTGAETAALMASLGAHDAVMLDGGGSTTMWIAGRGVVNRPSGGRRAVGNQIAVFGD